MYNIYNMKLLQKTKCNGNGTYINKLYIRIKETKFEFHNCEKHLFIFFIIYSYILHLPYICSK